MKETAFQDALGTTKTRWDWLAERVPDKRIMPAGPGYPGVPDISNRSQRPDKDGLIGRAELEIFSLAMVGGGRIFAAAQAFGKYINIHVSWALSGCEGKLTF